MVKNPPSKGKLIQIRGLRSHMSLGNSALAPQPECPRAAMKTQHRQKKKRKRESGEGQDSQRPPESLP